MSKIRHFVSFNVDFTTDNPNMTEQQVIERARHRLEEIQESRNLDEIAEWYDSEEVV